MGKLTTCDVCGKPARGAVTVMIQAMSVVSEGQPTATLLEQDMCDTCRPTAALALFQKAFMQQEAAIPKHVALIAERENEAQLRKELEASVTVRDTFANEKSTTDKEGVRWVSPADRDRFVQMDDKVRELVTAIEASDVRQAELQQ